jgi:hypothetical protein
MLRPLLLLLVLTALAGAAYGWLHALNHDCGRMEREAEAATVALGVCATTMSCRFTYQDLIAVSHQRHAADRCKALQP